MTTWKNERRIISCGRTLIIRFPIQPSIVAEITEFIEAQYISKKEKKNHLVQRSFTGNTLQNRLASCILCTCQFPRLRFVQTKAKLVHTRSHSIPNRMPLNTLITINLYSFYSKLTTNHRSATRKKIWTKKKINEDKRKGREWDVYTTVQHTGKEATANI